MKEGDHIAFAMTCGIVFFFALFYLIADKMLVFTVLCGCLGLATLAYYWADAWRERKSWHWEGVRRETQGMDLREMWATSERGDWLLWFAAHMIGKNGWPAHEDVVLASCKCARLTSNFIELSSPHTLGIVETTEAWARGESTPDDVINIVGATRYKSENDADYCAFEALKSAAWAVYAKEDGGCFRLAQAASGAATWASWAVGRRKGNPAEKDAMRECANIVRQMLIIPTELKNELPLYTSVRRWNKNASGKRTGMIDIIPIAISRSNRPFEVKGNEIDNAALSPAVRMITSFAAISATWMLIAALGKNPIEFYSILRWITCLSAVALTVRGDIQGSLKWAYVLVPIAVVFNPIVPIHIHGARSDILIAWQSIDVVAAFMLVAVAILMEVQVWRAKKRRKAPTEIALAVVG
jgi:hypothetical protein